MSGKLILVTGASGFVAGHVIEQLLALGYRVRGTARKAKITAIQATNIPNFEVVPVEDIATDDITEALKGIDVLLHVAAPLPGKCPRDVVMHSVFDGMMNVVRQAEKVGIKKIIVTSSFGTVVPDPSLAPGFAGLTLTEEDWGVTSWEAIASQSDPNDPFYAYFALKDLAEQELWKFAKEHPNVDITAILPGFVYGPWSKLLPRPTKGSPLGTNTYPWMVLNGHYPPTAPPWVADVRDVARAHVLAIDLPPSAPGTKRFLVNGGNYTWKEAAEHLIKVRPELTTVCKPEGFSPLPGPITVLDTTKARTVLGLTNLYAPEQTILDAIDSIVALGKEWEASA